MLKNPREMTLGEIEYLLHVHEWLTENERREMWLAFADITSKVNMILQRIKAMPLPTARSIPYLPLRAMKAKNDEEKRCQHWRNL
jgi:hypothetical protein